MRGRIVNYIFFDVPADADPVFPPAEEFSGLRPFRLRLLSFAEVFQIQLIDMLKHADAVVKIGCERKNCYRIPAWFRFSLFFGPAEIVFSDLDLDPHFPCVKLKLSGC